MERAQFRPRAQGWSVAIGGRDLAIGVAHAQNLGPAEALRVNLGFVNAYVLIRGKEAAVVDTGTPNNASKIADVVRTAGLGWDAVHHVILTHYHPDHIGSVGEVLAAAAKATAYAGAADIPQIKSPRPLKAVGDNDEVFGLRVIATPGHTPGHVCVFDPAGSLLILGDAMNNIGNKLGWSQSPVHRRHGPGAPECEEAGETHVPARRLRPRGPDRQGRLAGDRQAGRHPLRRLPDYNRRAVAATGHDRVKLS